MAGVEKLKSTGFVPQHTFAEGMEKTISFFQQKFAK